MPEPQRRWGIVRADWAAHSEVGADELAVLCLLSLHADKRDGTCYPSSNNPRPLSQAVAPLGDRRPEPTRGPWAGPARSAPGFTSPALHRGRTRRCPVLLPKAPCPGHESLP